MALNPYGGFNHRSPLSPCPSDPPLDLASDCIRDYFGPSVQTVADCLRSRGPSTIAQLVSRIRSQCRRVVNEERERLVERLPAAATMGAGKAVLKICPRARETRNRFISREHATKPPCAPTALLSVPTCTSTSAHAP